jgi:NADH-quinone oxidoreductase subunit D
VSTPRADTTEGRVYDVGGQDWDEIVAAAEETADSGRDERLIVNMGPQHPSTHGVLRLILTLDGETVTELRPVIGYLHTGIEKNMEFRTWTQASRSVPGRTTWRPCSTRPRTAWLSSGCSASLIRSPSGPASCGC